jgi:hypothetical protein
VRKVDVREPKSVRTGSVCVSGFHAKNIGRETVLLKRSPNKKVLGEFQGWRLPTLNRQSTRREIGGHFPVEAAIRRVATSAERLGMSTNAMERPITEK